MTTALSPTSITDTFTVTCVAPEKFKKAVSRIASSLFVTTGSRTESAVSVPFSSLLKEFQQNHPVLNRALLREADGAQLAIWIATAVSTQRISSEIMVLPLFHHVQIDTTKEVLNLAANPALVEMYKKDQRSPVVSYRHGGISYKQ